VRDLARNEPGRAPIAADGSSAATARSRLPAGVGGVVLLTSALALLYAAGIRPAGTAGDALGGLGLLCFWLIAPGAVLTPRLSLTTLTKVAVTPLIGIALLVGLGTAGAVTGVWIPRQSTAAVAALAAVVALVDLVRGGIRLRRPRLPRLGWASVLLGIALLASVGVWSASLRGIQQARPSVLGLLVAAPRTFPAAIVATAVVLLLALRGRRPYLAAAAGLALVVVLRSTASIVSPVPISSWTYKHLGVTEALQQHHHVTAGADIYMNWPGMFAAGAWFSDASGVAAIDLARWITPVVHVLIALPTAALARALGARATGCAAAAGLVVVLDWVGQDYYAPQAIAMCLAAGVVALLVQSRTSRAAALLALVLFAAIVVTHQLTPIWLVALAVVLVVLRRVPWWLALAMAALLAGYLGLHLDVARAYGLFSGFDPLANAAGNVPDVPAIGREVGGVFARASSLLMWGSTLVVLLARARRLGWKRGWRSPDVLVPAAIAFSPFLLLGGQSYGGEAILRVTLYSLLGCSAVLGPALANALVRGRLAALAAGVWALLVVATTAESSFTLWSVTLIQPEDVAAARWLAEQHGHAVVIPMINDWPGRTSVDYVRFIRPYATLEPGMDEILRTQSRLADVDAIPLSAANVTDVAQLHPGTPTYVVFTQPMSVYDEYYATYTAGSLEATRRQLLASPEWVLARHDGDVWVFRYRGAA